MEDRELQYYPEKKDNLKQAQQPSQDLVYTEFG